MTRLIALCLAVLMSACAADPYHLNGPGHVGMLGPATPKFLKSIRCEMITFLVQNRLRANLWAEKLPALRRALEKKDPSYRPQLDYLRNYPYIDIDATQYASIQADLKYIDSLSLSAGFDWQFIAVPQSIYNTYNVTPSYNQSRAFETVEPIALPQYADFGPLKNFGPINDPSLPKASKYTRLYAAQPDDDEGFYCYDSFYKSTATTVEDAIFDVQNLLTDKPEYQKFARFPRIYVDGRTLAEWFQLKTIDMASGYQTIHATYETIIPGQLVYNFTLTLKPSIGVSSKSFGGLLSTLSAAGGGGLEHTSNFVIYFNTPYSLPALAAKQGSTCIGKVVNGSCQVNQVTPNLIPERLENPSKRSQLSVGSVH